MMSKRKKNNITLSTERLQNNNNPVQMTDQDLLFLDQPVAIATYLCPNQSSSQILQWMFLARDHAHNVACSHFLDKNNVNKVEEEEKLLSSVDRALRDRTFLVGESLSLADVALAVELLPLCQDSLVSRKRFPHLVRWLNTCLFREEFVRVLGEMKPIV